MHFRKAIRRLIGTQNVIEANAAIRRELLAMSQSLAEGVDIGCDTETPRVELFRKSGSEPLIGPCECGWRARAVFDARPINFSGRRLVYFCGQPSYRTDRQAFIGRAEWRGDDLVIEDGPVIVPDSEARGIDIPAFTVVAERIVGVYFDDYGPRRTGRGTDTDLVLVESDDGRVFQKRFLKRPFASAQFDRIGLPWLLATEGTLSVYFRAKRRGENLLAVCELDAQAGSITAPEVLQAFPRNPINIAVTRRCDRYLIFYGATVGGGFYVAPSQDGRRFDFSAETMIVSNENEWGWDYHKVCASPDNSGDDDLTLWYTSPTGGALAVGAGKISAQALVRHLEMLHPSPKRCRSGRAAFGPSPAAARRKKQF